ncbi:hypothetical protein QYF36_024201 [Acer negundo]|nr:hypothetical protein QYF36_024201 [Acer negundo]
MCPRGPRCIHVCPRAIWMPQCRLGIEHGLPDWPTPLLVDIGGRYPPLTRRETMYYLCELKSLPSIRLRWHSFCLLISGALYSGENILVFGALLPSLRLSKAYVSPSLVAFPLVFCLGRDFALEDLLRWDYSKRTIVLALVEPSKQGAPLSSGQGRFQEELEKQVFHLFTNSFKECKTLVLTEPEIKSSKI